MVFPTVLLMMPMQRQLHPMLSMERVAKLLSHLMNMVLQDLMVLLELQDRDLLEEMDHQDHQLAQAAAAQVVQEEVVQAELEQALTLLG
jgi:hypothetical protein